MAEATVSQHLGAGQGDDDFLTVAYSHAADWRRDDCGTPTLSDAEAANATMALSGIQAITAVLMQREVDADCDGPACLRLSTVTTVGLLEAISTCAEMVDMQLQAAIRRGPPKAA